MTCGCRRSNESTVGYPLANVTEVPSYYDWSQPTPDKWNWCDMGVAHENFCTASWNQHIPKYCGACYLHGTLSMMNDRLKIANAKRGHSQDIMLGRQTFLNCAPYHGMSLGCNGGEPANVLEYMRQYGLPDETCMHYGASDFRAFPESLARCPAIAECMNCFPIDGVNQCFPVDSFTRYHVSHYGRVLSSSNSSSSSDDGGDDGGASSSSSSAEEQMKREIASHGPIVCSIATPDDFNWNYRGDVYNDTTNAQNVDHDVEIVGWDTDEQGTPYWLIRNSWGTYWGENGFFRLLRGSNNLRVEEDCWYGIPTVAADLLEVEARDVIGSLTGLKKRKATSSVDSSQTNGLLPSATIPADNVMPALMTGETIIPALINGAATSTPLEEGDTTDAGGSLSSNSGHQYSATGAVGLTILGIALVVFATMVTSVILDAMRHRRRRAMERTSYTEL